MKKTNSYHVRKNRFLFAYTHFIAFVWGAFMEEKYVIVKNTDGLAAKRNIGLEEYRSLYNAAQILEEFDYIAFLANSFESEREAFLSYDFSQFNVREIDMFSMMLNSLNAIATNNNLWEAYLKRKYKSDPEIFLLHLLHLPPKRNQSLA